MKGEGDSRGRPPLCLPPSVGGIPQQDRHKAPTTDPNHSLSLLTNYPFELLTLVTVPELPLNWTSNFTEAPL